MDCSLLGVLILDREPLTLANVPGLAFAWLQDAGGFAALGLLVYLLAVMLQPAEQSSSNKLRLPINGWMVAMAVLSMLTYAVLLAMILMDRGAIPEEELPPPPQIGDLVRYVPPKIYPYWQPVLLALAGLFAILGIIQPFARDLLKLRWRRIYALGKICFKEAIRNRIFLGFLLFLILFLFPVSWVGNLKPEDELRTPINIFTVGKSLFLTIPFLILAAFAIPTDIRNQTLYTIVTKPVERFEIALGRFLGYSALMTIVLYSMVALCTIYVYTIRIDEKAQQETFKARVTARGKLTFSSRLGGFDGTNVGREFEYRKYIGGHPTTNERAIWSFSEIPANLLRRERDAVLCEYTLDIFRLTKGDENRGVDTNFRFCTWQTGQLPGIRGQGIYRWADAEKGRRYEAERQEINDKLRAGGYGGGYERSLDYARPGTPTWKLVDELAKKYGFYEVPSAEVYDYRPGSVPVPVGLFETAAEGDAIVDGKEVPRLRVYVKCLSPGQMLGMAEADLYLLEGEKSFAENYFKSAFGLWCRLVIVIGLAVTLSTYLAALIALFGTLFLYTAAYFAEHIRDIGTSTSVGGGPFEGTLRLIRGDTASMPLDPSSTVAAVTWGDQAYAWIFRRFANVIPDVDAFSWSEFLAEGYNVNFEYLIVNVIVLLGYLLPWGVLAYYLMRNREVAA